MAIKKAETKTQEQTMGTKEVAAMAGVDPRDLRRLLRKQFGGGSKKAYVWKKGDPEIQKIVAAVKASKEPKPEKPAEKPKATKTPASKGTARGKAPAKKTTKKIKKPAEETPITETPAEEPGLETELTIN